MKGQRLKKTPTGTAKRPTVTRCFLEALTGAREDAYRRVLDALSLSRREKLSPTKAARATGTTVKTMRKYASSAIEERGGRLYVKPSDRLPRRMRMLSTQGEIAVRTTSSRTASRIADYNNAMRAYVLTQDTTDLARFKGKTVRSGGQVHEFATDRRTIDRYARAGAIHFVDIYARGAQA
jgi:hypothetical protein